MDIQKIIIADNSKNLLKFYKEMLMLHFEEKVEILTCENGIEAMQLIKALNWADEVLCVISDLDMPLMNGQELAKHLQRMFEPPHIFIHSSADIEERRELQNHFWHGEATVVSKENSTGETIVSWIKEQLEIKKAKKTEAFQLR